MNKIINLNDSIKNVKKYNVAKIENTYYLGYRDIPLFIKKYVTGKKAIDYGCGTGRSSRFLNDLGFNCLGVDNSKKMLEYAQRQDDGLHYLQIDSGHIPVLDNSCDLVFCCFVLFTIPLKSELSKIFKEIYRCLKKGGIFIVVTGSENLYSHDWLSYNTRFPENKNLSSGSLTKIRLVDLGIDFINYYWTDGDYTDLFHSNHFHIIEKHFPLGNLSDNINWISELKFSPYAIYLGKK